ncbi:chlorophyll synthesis pathway protein BchC [Polynucleobacter paneuropaeus]|nr:chlorophyll synthesis pathway protein BchC [Polynucleobacter paneuropaeus]MBT8610940.1 chlorophyll synthesis pathway protein BchC [Polynucleobacter paneuropaeus]
MHSQLHSTVVLLESPKELRLKRLLLDEPNDSDVVVQIEWSGISTGTEKLLWNGTMPDFPGMGYPLVPGYESVGRVTRAGKSSHLSLNKRVFVPGAKCFGDVKGLFGGASSHVVVPSDRVIELPEEIGEEGILLALAATAYHVTQGKKSLQPDLIVGHGVLGRLIARIAVMFGHKPVVWEIDAGRMSGAEGYTVLHPCDDQENNYKNICDASGQVSVLNKLVSQLQLGGEITLAGFYDKDIQFNFPRAFMKEAKFRIAAQWAPQDLKDVKQLISKGILNLDGLITHHRKPSSISDAYRTAFEDPNCLKMVVDWREAL